MWTSPGFEKLLYIIKSWSNRRTGDQSSEDVAFRLVSAPNFAEEARTLPEASLETIHPEDDIAVRESTPCTDEAAPASDVIDIIILPQSSTSLSVAPLYNDDEPPSNHEENCPPLLPSLTKLEAKEQIEVSENKKPESMSILEKVKSLEKVTQSSGEYVEPVDSKDTTLSLSNPWPYDFCPQ